MTKDHRDTRPVTRQGATPGARRRRGPLTDIEFRHLGEGHVSYVRPLTAGDLAARFPGLPAVAEETPLWGLFSANGSPIVVSDERQSVVEAAASQELMTVSVH